jgi:type I restriction enzyme S subunit
MLEWKSRRIGELAKVNYGYTEKASFEQIGPKFLRITDIQNGSVEWAKVPYCKISDADYQKHKLEVDDIVFARTGATTGKYYRIQDSLDMVAASYLIRLRFTSDEITPEFLSLFFETPDYRKLITEGTSGSAQGGFNASKLSDLVVPLPPIETQKKIVAKLDQTFADIEKAKSNAEQNLNNAKELFESYLQGIFSHSQEGWAESNLQNITVKIGSGATPRGGKAAYKEHGMSLIRSMNVHDRRFKEKNLALIDDEQAGKLNNVTLEKDDVLLNITGASVARCCVVPDEYLPARVNQHVSIIRVDKDIISPRFMCFLLTSTYYKNILLEVGGSGATREAITKVQLQNFVITYPDTVEKQEEFLDELTGIESHSIELQNIYTKKIQALDELKQSILQKAFNGELA